MTLAAMLGDAAARSPHAVAIHTSAGSLSYADLADRVARKEKNCVPFSHTLTP